MKIKLLPTLLIVLLSIGATAQTNFESGYFIDNNGNRVDCLIWNEKWSSSPKEVTFRRNSGQTDKENFSVNNVRQFGIGDNTIYKRVSSSFILASLSPGSLERSFEFQPVSQTVFVKQIVFGEIGLYEWRNGSVRNYLIQTPEYSMQVLRYKKYSEDGYKIKENNDFRRQLLRILPCDQINVQDLSYTEKDLVNYIDKYLQCTGQQGMNSESIVKKEKDDLRLKVWFGAQNMDFKFNNTATFQLLDFENKTVLTGGLELEMVFGINNYKWSAFLTSTYGAYKAELEEPIDATNRTDIYQLELSRLENLVGGRHYFYISPSSSIFLEAGLSFDFSFDSGFSSSLDSEPLESDNFFESRSLNFGAGFGVGYQLNAKYYLRGNYYLKQNIISGYRAGNELSRYALLVGFRIL